MQKNNHRDAKLQPFQCKVATFGVQSYNHQDAKLQLSECKVTTIGMPFQIFRFQFEIYSIHQWRIFDWKYLRLPSDNALLSL